MTATAALEAEVLATTSAEGKKCRERTRRVCKRDSPSQTKLAAVRAAMEAEGADPLEVLKAVQTALTATADEEESDDDSESEADAAASMSAQSGDEGGVEFESAGEGWMRRDGKGRSRSAGAERQRSADPLRRNRDRSPRLGRPGRGGKAAGSAAAAACASADSDEV